MTLSETFSHAIDLAERAEKLADIMLRERQHEYHRLGVSLRDFSLSVSQALTSLSDDAILVRDKAKASIGQYSYDWPPLSADRSRHAAREASGAIRKNSRGPSGR